MTAVTRLVTRVELDDRSADARQMSFSARHEAVLTDGRRVLLLGDRGWTSTLVGPVPAGVWSVTSAQEIEAEARTAVGPDEPFAGRSQRDMEASHWAYLAGVLRDQGVVVDAGELEGLPHEVVLGERLSACLGPRRGDAASP